MSLSITIVWLSAALGAAEGGGQRFQPPQHGAQLGVWRVTNDPTVRYWANYHNTQCWSPDGRYLCYTSYGGRLERDRYREHNTVWLYDMWKRETRSVGEGHSPRWARGHNWLFYVHEDPAGGPSYEKGAEVRWLDVDTGEQVRVCYGIEQLGETDFQDRWLYGAARYRGQQPELRIHRLPLQRDCQSEPLPDVAGSQLLPSPGHGVFFTRQDHKDEPFGATRWWFDLEGGNRRIFAPTLQQCHMCWLGNGEYLLLGNSLIRGRRWDEPFPSNVHLLASVAVGDVSPCGRSGRYACGDSRVADLRSGDGWFFIEPLSIICFPKSIGDNSGIYDADPKGSPDGTKVCFVSNYDLKDGPITYISEDTSRQAASLRVESTAGFPESGAVVVQREVIGYQRKTAGSFEGLSRALYDTLEANLRQGRAVTSFEARCLSETQWNEMPGPSNPMRHSIPDLNSPLIRQRQTDVYVAVVRKPDSPRLRVDGDAVALLPGEEHFETCGYHLLREGQRITSEPLSPGASLTLEPGAYRAVAVEFSGLESEPGNVLNVSKKAALQVLAEPPADFSWTRERWLVNAAEVSPEAARLAPEAIRETLHAHDGTIQREWYQQGLLTVRHDLGLEGDAIRRMRFADGKPETREYYDRAGVRLSRETFDEQGFITEQILYGQDGREADHWFFDRGLPVRQVRNNREYVKRGERFGYYQDGKFIDTPRGALSQ